MIFVWLILCVVIPFLCSYIIGSFTSGTLNIEDWNADSKNVSSGVYFGLQFIGLLLFVIKLAKSGYFVVLN